MAVVTQHNVDLVYEAASLLSVRRLGHPMFLLFNDAKRSEADEQYFYSRTLTHMFYYELVDYINANDPIIRLIDPGVVKGM